MSELTQLFTDVADKIREKEKSSDLIPVKSFSDRIGKLSGKMEIADDSGNTYNAAEIFPVEYKPSQIATWTEKHGSSESNFVPGILVTKNGTLYAAWKDNARSDSSWPNTKMSAYINDVFSGTWTATESGSCDISLIAEGESDTCIILRKEVHPGEHLHLKCINNKAEEVWSEYISVIDVGTTIAQKNQGFIYVYYQYYYSQDKYRISKYDKSGNLINEITEGVPKSEVFCVDDKDNFYFYVRPNIVKYSAQMEKILEFDTGMGTGTYQEPRDMYPLDDNTIVVHNIESTGRIQCYESGELKWKYFAQNEIYRMKIQNNAIYLNLRQGSYVHYFKKYIIRDFLLKTWEYTYSSSFASNSNFCFGEDCVYIFDTDYHYKKLTNEKRSTNYMATMTKINGGGTLTE